MNTIAERYSETTLLTLAREIAWEIHPLEHILRTASVSPEHFEEIRKLPRFQQYLTSELQAWASATNSHERVKVKSSIMLEVWLAELNARLYDPRESLSAKLEGGKLLARLAGMGLDKAGITDGGEKFSVTINLGADSSLKFEKTSPARVIEGEVVDADH